MHRNAEGTISLTDEEFNAVMRNLGQPENMVVIKKKQPKMSKEMPSLKLPKRLARQKTRKSTMKFRVGKLTLLL